jgi:AcrR family transcriptional regulator
MAVSVKFDWLKTLCTRYWLLYDPDVPERKRGPYAKTRGRIEAITSAAYDLVLERGHREITTVEIAERAGVTEAQLLYHFPSKDHVFVAAMEQADLQATRELLDRPTDPQAVEEGLRNFVRHSMGRPNLALLQAALRVEASDPGHPAAAWVRRHREQSHEHYGDLVGLLQQTGYAHPNVDPAAFGRQLAALWEGLELQWLAEPSLDLAEEIVQAFRAITRHNEMAARRALEQAMSEF